MAATLRDVLVERLIAEFGEPWRVGKNFRWTIARIFHAPVNISLDSWRTPRHIAVWVFDPSKEGTAGVWSRKLERAEQIDELVKELWKELDESNVKG